MKSTKILAGLLSVAFLSLSAVAPVSADYVDNQNPIARTGKLGPVSAQLGEKDQFSFGSFTGVVKEVTIREGVQGSKYILVENEAGNPANIVITNETYILDNAEIKVGSTITGYFNANAFMIMIYPPQYCAEVVVVENQEQNVKVDIFDKDLVSADNSLELNISPETEIVSQDGNAFKGELANRKLVVKYSTSTRSIPAQTNPEKIVVLSEKENPPMQEFPSAGDAAGVVSNMDVVVNDVVIKAPAAYKDKKGTVMVPLRAIAEALGFDVMWNNEGRSIMLDKDISLTIGVDNYIYGQNPPIQLGSVPILVEETTFVPLSFFREVLEINNAYVSESQIAINNGEKTE